MFDQHNNIKIKKIFCGTNHVSVNLLGPIDRRKTV